MLEMMTKSPQETMDFAKKMASGKILKTGSIVLLLGEVGSGKTTFVKGFASNWNLDSNVTSPTFTIINEYKNDSVKIYHIDLYRLSNLKEIDEIGIEDFISNCDFSFIEWPVKAAPLLNFKTVNIHISIGKLETERIFKID